MSVCGNGNWKNGMEKNKSPYLLAPPYVDTRIEPPTLSRSDQQIEKKIRGPI